MPWADEKGLLPGRGAPGFGALPSPEDGAAGAGADGFAGADGAGAFSAAGAGAGLGAGAAGAAGPGLGPGFGPGVGAEDFGAGFAAGFAAAGSEAALRDGSASIAARSLRATGGSTVEDGLFTNSPSSLSFASATLLSTPSSAAISCTRGLPATILLSGSVCPDRADH
jgi:hypothetical protein